MERHIKDAIQLLRENGYIVKKLTDSMKKDSDECQLSVCEKDCLGCSCSVCIVQ